MGALSVFLMILGIAWFWSNPLVGLVLVCASFACASMVDNAITSGDGPEAMMFLGAVGGILVAIFA